MATSLQYGGGEVHGGGARYSYSAPILLDGRVVCKTGGGALAVIDVGPVNVQVSLTKSDDRKGEN